MKSTIPIIENYIFRRMYRQGRNIVTPHVVVYTKKNKLACNRMGITASKKIGNAVERNRARRLVKEAYRLLEPDLPKGLDIVFVARKKAVYSSMHDVKNSLEKTFLK